MLQLGSSSPSSASSPAIGRMCAFPELQFRLPITDKEAELAEGGTSCHRLLSDLGVWPDDGRHV
ncbi:unnamed protein product, partial [Staurois parvus]